MGNPKCKDKKKDWRSIEKKVLLSFLHTVTIFLKEPGKTEVILDKQATSYYWKYILLWPKKKLCKVAVQIACKVGDKNLQLTYKTPNPRSLGQNLVFFCRSFANYNFQKCLFPELIGYKYSYMYMCTIRPVATLSKCFIFGLNWIKLPIIVQQK